MGQASLMLECSILSFNLPRFDYCLTLFHLEVCTICSNGRKIANLFHRGIQVVEILFKRNLVKCVII